MELAPMIGLAVIAVVLVVLFRQYRPEYAVLVSVLAGILILSMILTGIQPALDEMNRLVQMTGMAEEYTQVLMKSLGICFITQIACDACKDAGETSIAGKVEIAGKVAVVLLTLPLFSALMQTALKLIG